MSDYLKPYQAGYDIDGVIFSNKLNPIQGLTKVYLPAMMGVSQGLHQIEQMEDVNSLGFYTKRAPVRNPFTRMDLRRNGINDMRITNTMNSHLGKVEQLVKDGAGDISADGTLIKDESGVYLLRPSTERVVLVDDSEEILAAVDDLLETHPELQLLLSSLAVIGFSSPQNKRPYKLPFSSSVPVIPMNGWGYDEVARAFEDLRNLKSFKNNTSP